MMRLPLSVLLLSALWAGQGCQSNAAKDTTTTANDSTASTVTVTSTTANEATTPASNSAAMPDSVAAAGKALTPLDSLGLIGPKITGAILPGKRILAFYGNPHSKKMGILG